jgi:hypothetical protein
MNPAAARVLRAATLDAPITFGTTASGAAVGVELGGGSEP